MIAMAALRIRNVGSSIYEVLTPYKFGAFVAALQQEFGPNATWEPRGGKRGAWVIRCTRAPILDLCLRWWGEVRLRAGLQGPYVTIKRHDETQGIRAGEGRTA